MDRLILFICVACLFYATQAHIVYDPRYTIPVCDETQSPVLPNQYATLTLSSDMMRENLTLDLETHSLGIYSCYLCQTQVLSGYYCNSSVAQSDVTLSLDLTFNMLVIGVSHGTAFPHIQSGYRNHFAFDAMRESLPVARVTSEPVSCDTPLDLVIMPVLTLFYPHQIDFVTMVRDAADINDTQLVACNDSTTRIFPSVACSLIRQRYTYVTLETPNCVADRLTPVPLGADLSTVPRYTPLYWYRESLRGVYRATATATVIEAMQLCGTPMIGVLCDSNMTLLCGTNSHYYVQFWSWYLLAQQVIAARLNLYAVPGRTPHIQSALKRTIGMSLLAAQIVLEQSCDRRQELSLGQPSVYALYRDLVQFNLADDQSPNTTALLCADVARLLNMTVAQLDTLFLPRYLAYYAEWFFQYFQYILYWGASEGTDGESMRIGGIILLTVVAMSGLSCVVFLFILPTWICCSHWCREYRRRRHKKKKSQKRKKGAAVVRPQQGYEIIQ